MMGTLTLMWLELIELLKNLLNGLLKAEQDSWKSYKSSKCGHFHWDMQELRKTKVSELTIVSILPFNM